MSQSRLSPFDLPLIVETIAESLSFDDLLRCILVCRAWHAHFIPPLWSDVITFRTIDSSRNFEIMPAIDSQSLIKHAHHIRALTCSIDTMPALLESRFEKLQEINYVRDYDKRPRPRFGLDQLAWVIARSPRLRAVSIENVDIFYGDDDLKALKDFVNVLDNYPLVTCLFVSFGTVPRDCSVPLYAIIEQRLARVRRCSITSLIVKEYHEMPRSKRGPPAASGSARQYHWPGRSRCQEQNKDPRYIRIRPNKVCGRWEHEPQRQQCQHALAVLENAGVLEVCLSPAIWGGSSQTLLGRLPGLTSVSINDRPEFVFEKELRLQARHSDLSEFEWSYAKKDDSILNNTFHQFLQDGRVNLSSVNLRRMPTAVYQSVMRPLIVQELQEDNLGKDHFLRHALVSLTVTDTNHGRQFPLAHLLEILTRCPKLQAISVGLVHINGTEKTTNTPWVCSELQSLDVRFDLTDPTDSRKLVDANETARCFMGQLGAMAQLQDLKLRVTGMYRHPVPKSPFLQLTLNDENGLEQLARLSRLEVLSVSGTPYAFGDVEREWIAKHWPYIRLIGP